MSSISQFLRFRRRNPVADPPRPALLNVLLFVTTAFVYLLSGKTFFGYDGEIMYRVSESLVLRHSIQIVDPIYHASQPYAAYGIGLSLLMAPLVALGALLAHDPRLLVTLLEPLVTAATVVALNALMVELGCSWRRSLAIALVYAFGTLAWYYSGILFTEPVIGLCVVLAMLGLVLYRRRGDLRWLIMSGAAVGLSVITRWDCVLTIAVPIGLYGLYAIVRSSQPRLMRLRALAALGAPVLLAIGVNVGYDIARFGHPLGGPYAADPLGFSTPLMKGVYGLLLSPGVGLFIYTPVLLMSTLGFPWFFRRWKVEAGLVLVLFLLRVGFYARYWAWEGGATWGPRFLVPMIPLLLLPLAFLPRDRRIRIATAALAALGLGIQLLGQLVPYGLYYGTVVPQLTTRLGLCQGCLPLPGRQSEAVNAVTDFDWTLAPLPTQARYLMHGIMAPTWGPIVIALPILLLGVLFVGLRLCSLAAALDASSREDTGLGGAEHAHGRGAVA